MIPAIAHLLVAVLATLIIFLTSDDTWLDIWVYWLFHIMAFGYMALCGFVAVLVSWVSKLGVNPSE